MGQLRHPFFSALVLIVVLFHGLAHSKLKCIEEDDSEEDYAIDYPSTINPDDTATESSAEDSNAARAKRQQEPPVGKCVMQGICAKSGIGGHPILCAQEAEPMKLNDTLAIKIFKEICPHLMKEDEDAPVVCCTPDVVKSLRTIFRMPSQMGLGECASCMHNFRATFCNLLCSPRQSHHVKILATSKSENGRTQVDEINYYVNEKFVNQAYDSCKGVQGGSIMRLMCGRQGLRNQCNGKHWADFMGATRKHGGYAPYQINFILSNEEQIEDDGQTYFPMMEKTYGCNEAPDEDSEPCHCEDCEAACEGSDDEGDDESGGESDSDD